MTENEWLAERVQRTREIIVSYEDAIEAISSGAQTYSLDTGQTRQVVSKAQLGSLQLTLQRLETRLSTYQQRLCGVQTIMRPGW